MIPEFNYASYIWSSYGLFVVVVAWQLVVPRLRRQRILAELREERALSTGDYE